MAGEEFKADNSDEIVWLRLNRLKSVHLCEKLIENRLAKSPNTQINDALIKSKAIGLSSAIESAIGYWQATPQSLNAKILSRYYFLLQMTIAEQVSSISNIYDLKAIQKHTENGHGLGTISNMAEDFPNGYYVFCLLGGHFYSYAKSIGLQIKDIALEKRPRKFEDVSDISKLENVTDIFRRIPELRNVIEEYLGKPPLSFHVGFGQKIC